MSEFVDQQKTCRDCSNQFMFSASEQKFFSEMGYSAPVRCKPCRDQRKASKGPTAQESQKGVLQPHSVDTRVSARKLHRDDDDSDFNLKRPRHMRRTRRQRAEEENDEWDY